MGFPAGAIQKLTSNGGTVTITAPTGPTTDLAVAAAGVASVAAADTSIVIAGTATNPTVKTNTLDVIATVHAPAAAVPLNAQKITGLANGTAATDAAAFGQIPAAAFVQLYDSLLGVSAASFDITSISQAYNHLRVVLYLRCDDVATLEGINMRLNNDSAANYDYQYQSASAGSSGPAEQFGSTASQVGLAPGASAGANLFSATTIDIPNYAGANNKAFTWQTVTKSGTSSGNMIARQGGGFWRSNVAISRVTILDNGGGNFVAGSRATLYGLL